MPFHNSCWVSVCFSAAFCLQGCIRTLWSAHRCAHQSTLCRTWYVWLVTTTTTSKQNTSQCVTNERRKVTSQTTAIPINISPISYRTFTRLSKQPQIWWVWNTLLHKEHCSTCLLIGKRQISWSHHSNNTRSNTLDVQLPFIFLPSQSLISLINEIINLHIGM